MSNTSANGTLRLNTQASPSNHAGEDVTLTLDASKPVTVRIEVDRCPCGSEHNRAGSYVDTDFSR
ncbi:hypothetical protein [Paenarthrobacter nitroguajacolicus]|uniref:hypothetical protein n=1 Tax=Paenarthrobacter nitroguajacolicus TaxID=211146 RepID=UPI0015C0FC3B|nr:hypothetical protein [Paenarthrobacter nitroguajacolicus]NWL31342.1 hypothetical protein [Paenarthrobacter nitroguajacolicus]